MFGIDLHATGNARFWLHGAATVVITAAAARGSLLQLEGGGFEANGALTVDGLTVNAGAVLSGAGGITGPSSVAGTLAPGCDAQGGAGLLQFGASLAFLPGSVLACHAASHTAISGVEAAGVVSGSAQVRLSKAPGAIPLGQPIVRGGPGTTYAAFRVADAGAAQWQLLSADGRNLLVSDLVGDSNSNGLPDWWEVDNFGGRTNGNAAADSDRDGMDDGDEYVAGTCPTNAGSRLCVEVVAMPVSNRFVIAWPSVSNRVYVVQGATDLASGFGATLANGIPATPPLNRYTNEITGTAMRFYRIGIQQ